ncbi:hypothetical protein GH714_004450 [Hevea brasiliensis]|uniref:MLO-like protein n=1 Tax=Hevea brasiliensis TaxID=3981 RepID=A0A6A6KGS2_HEVBR|nr:hypothetical protein GH714_004450 [Hevea brasiliensis]
MLLGFISLLLTVSLGTISKICVPEHVITNMLPCNLAEKSKGEKSNTTATTEHFQRFFSTSISDTARRLLAESTESQIGYCARKDKVPLLSVEALHHLHIFIFVLAIVHVAYSVLTVLFGGARIRQWQHWENSIAKYDTGEVLRKKVTHVRQNTFIREHFLGIGKDSALLGWVHSFFKQFYASVTKSDYITLRLGFIMTHCRGNPNFNFHRYVLRALEDDFKIVVDGLRKMHLNHAGFTPLVIIQILCSYSTLPLYAIVTQMGSYYKKAIFEEHIQASVLGWAEKAKRKAGLKAAAAKDGSNQSSPHQSSSGIQLGRVGRNGSTQEIQPSAGSGGQT